MKKFMVVGTVLAVAALAGAARAEAGDVDIQAVDAAGDEAATCCDVVRFTCRGSGKIIGVGNGDPLSHEDDVCAEGKWQRRLFNGKCQVVLKAGRTPGPLRLVARLESTGREIDVVIQVK